VLSHDDFKKKIKQEAIKRAEEFSFEKTARETLGVYQEVYKN
jgi:hypothetical protein